MVLICEFFSTQLLIVSSSSVSFVLLVSPFESLFLPCLGVFIILCFLLHHSSFFSSIFHLFNLLIQIFHIFPSFTPFFPVCPRSLSSICISSQNSKVARSGTPVRLPSEVRFSSVLFLLAFSPTADLQCHRAGERTTITVMDS